MPITMPKAILIDTVTGEAVELLFLSTVSMSVTANYDGKEPRGTSQPFFHYSHTGAKTLSLPFRLVSSVERNDGGTTEDVINDLRFLESLLYPDYLAGEFLSPPHVVRLWMGKLFDEEGFISAWNPNISPPYDENFLPQFVDMTLEFTRIGKMLGYSDVRTIL